jgi:hypothetical protein
VAKGKNEKLKKPYLTFVSSAAFIYIWYMPYWLFLAFGRSKGSQEHVDF